MGCGLSGASGQVVVCLVVVECRVELGPALNMVGAHATLLPMQHMGSNMRRNPVTIKLVLLVRYGHTVQAL